MVKSLIGITEPLVQVYTDNEAAYKAATNPTYAMTERSKHIDVKYFAVRHNVEQGEVAVSHVPTTEMKADIFTKPLKEEVFKRVRQLGGVSP